MKVFDGTNPSAVIHQFHAFGTGFLGGVFVAAGEMTGDGKAEIIAGAGPGGGPAVRVFSGADAALLTTLFVYESGYTGGVRVAAGDMDGDNRVDIITAPGGNHEPRVKVFEALTWAEMTPTGGTLAYASTMTKSVFVAAFPLPGVIGLPSSSSGSSLSIAAVEPVSGEELTGFQFVVLAGPRNST